MNDNYLNILEIIEMMKSVSQNQMIEMDYMKKQIEYLESLLPKQQYYKRDQMFYVTNGSMSGWSVPNSTKIWLEIEICNNLEKGLIFYDIVGNVYSEIPNG